jgi:hypothetical protein
MTPAARRAHAQNTTERTNAALPSNVFDELGDHRCRPMRLPAMDACPWMISSLCVGAHASTRTNASPTPKDNTPVNSRIRDGLGMGTMRQQHTICKEVLTLQATRTQRNPSTDKNGSGSPSHCPCDPKIHSRIGGPQHQMGIAQSIARTPRTQTVRMRRLRTGAGMQANPQVAQKVSGEHA